MAPELQPSAVTANPTANGNCVRVRLRIGTLKEASMVAYFSESSRSRLRNVLIQWGDPIPDAPPIVRKERTDSQEEGQVPLEMTRRPATEKRVPLSTRRC